MNKQRSDDVLSQLTTDNQQWIEEVRPYVEHGKRVFWIHKGDKHPSHEKRWNDPAIPNLTLEQLAVGLLDRQQKPICISGFGVAQGSYSGFEHTLDFDNAQHYEAVQQRVRDELNVDITELTTVITGRDDGGVHLIFVTDGDLDGNILVYEFEPARTTGLTAAIELKGMNRFAVRPPSLHKSGRRYQCVSGVAYDPIHIPLEQAVKLVDVCRSFNEDWGIKWTEIRDEIAAKVKRHDVNQSSTFTNAKEVRARFNQQHAIGDLLDQYGYIPVRYGFYNHPNDDTANGSVHVTDGMSFHFGANDPVEGGIQCGPCQGFDAFGLYCSLEHGNDCATAVKAAASEMGFTAAKRSTYAPTDLGNPEFFAEEYGDEVRYVYEWRSWIHWDGKRWKIDKSGQIHRKAYNLVKYRMADHAKDIDDEDQRTAYFKHIGRSQGRSRIESIISLAAPMLSIQATELDANPWLLNCRNGTIDLKTGELRPHGRRNMLTKLAPVNFEPGASCPLWESFLQRIFSDPSAGRARTDLIEFIQRSAGYSLTRSVESQVFWILHGSGANGKTTLMNTLQFIMGDYGISAQQSLLMADSRFRSNNADEAELLGIRLAVCSETDEGQRFAENKVKRITGGGKIRARRLYENSFEFNPTHKIWLDCNHKPKISGTDYALKRRVMFVPFDVTIPSGERDEHLGEKLKAEASGILNWMFKGLESWQQDGLCPPRIVINAVDDYMTENDLLGQFLAENTIDNPIGRVEVDELYRTYKSWCEDSGLEHPLTKIALGRKLVERGYETIKSTRWYWIGLELDSEAGEDDQDFFLAATNDKT